jgi:ACS family hexuronate transporter-like MFS transporter
MGTPQSQASRATQPANPVVPMESWTRWIAIGVFVLSSSLNYLDRLLLAALAPTIKIEFHLSNAEYGQIISVFSFVYALMAPLAGWLVDRVGLNAGITAAMSVWSLAGAATGLTQSLRGLIACRTVLGIGEAAGIPCTGKANGLYLAPRELALGTAMNQVGITIGSVAAPLMVAALAPVYGWRYTFVVSGVLGFLWIPLWWFVSRRVPARTRAQETPPAGLGDILSDTRMWGLISANALVMTLYTLWTNWTTVYLVQERHLTEIDANRQFAWIPPVFATLGGFTGGWMAFRAIQNGSEVFASRMRVCWISAVLLLATALVPIAPSPVLAVAAISVSFFWCLAISTNLYAMPIDWFGPGRAAFGVSIITCSFGLMTALISPAIGAVVDQFGFAPVCTVMSVLPLAGIAVLRVSAR